MARAVVRRQGRRPDYQWNGVTGLFATSLSSTQALMGSIVTFGSAETLMRIRGHALVIMDPGAADETMVVHIGITVADDAQFTAGATAFPSPTTNQEENWVWHGQFPLRSNTGTQGDIVGGQVWQAIVDSKAMRKVHANDVLAVMVDANILSGTPTADIVLSARALIAR